MERTLIKQNINQFRTWLQTEEKSKNTIQKYIRDVTAFMDYIAGAAVTKEIAIAYKIITHNMGDAPTYGKDGLFRRSAENVEKACAARLVELFAASIKKTACI